MLSIGLGLLELFVALGISKAFDRVWHAGLFQKLNPYGIVGLSFPRNRRHKVILDGTSSQEYPVNAGVPQFSILAPTLFLLSLMTFLILLTTLSVIRHRICDKN